MVYDNVDAETKQWQSYAGENEFWERVYLFNQAEGGLPPGP